MPFRQSKWKGSDALIAAIICARLLTLQGSQRRSKSRAMRRLILSLTLLLFCGAVAAEQVVPSKTAATPLPPRPTAKPAPKKAGPKPPPARALFGAVPGPAPLASRSLGCYAHGRLAGGV